MSARASFPILVPVCIALGSGARAAAEVEPHAGMLRYPDVSATHIAFLYANDLCLAPREGGLTCSSPPVRAAG